MNPRFALVAAAFASLVAHPVRAETVEQVIARARTYLGGEQALNAITSIHFIGTLETTMKVPSATDKTMMIDQPVRFPAEIIVQKPYQQQFKVTQPESIEMRVLDGYDGWVQISSREHPNQRGLSLLDGAEIKQMRANTWENLNFFSGLELKGGRVQAEGEVNVEGVVCVKLAFIHTDEIVFHRFFDRATGRLVRTETESGGEIREEGETIVNGVRFPRKVINKAANGRVTTLAFDKIVLNEAVPAGEFAVPSYPVN